MKAVQNKTDNSNL